MMEKKYELAANSTVSGLAYGDSAHKKIALTITLARIGVPIPMIVSADYDTEEGRAIYSDAVAGIFGDIAAYTPPPSPTQEQLITAAQQVVQNALDSKAREREYEGILSLCSYANSTNPKFSAESQAGIAWRDAAWSAQYQLQADILAGAKPAPTTLAQAVELALSVMPAMEWPT